MHLISKEKPTGLFIMGGFFLLMSMIYIAGQFSTSAMVEASLESVATPLGISHIGSSRAQILETAADILKEGPSELAKGHFPPNLPHLKIHIKQRHLDVLKQDRALARHRRILCNPHEVPALIEMGNDFIKCKLRLKGDRSQHWDLGYRWSLRVTLEKGQFISNVSEFSLQRPVCRQFPADYYFQNLVRDMGNLSPESTFARVSVNGDDWGVQLIEEHVGRHLLEKQNRSEGVLFRINSQRGTAYRIINGAHGVPIHRSLSENYDAPIVDLIGDKKVARSTHLSKQASYLIASFERYKAGEISAWDLFDADSFSKAFLAAAMWNNLHTLSPRNARLYLNPYTLRVEIITTDQGIAEAHDAESGGSAFYEGIMKKNYPIFSAFLRDQRFSRVLSDNMALVESSLENHPEWRGRLETVFPLEENNCRLDLSLLQDNLKRMETEMPRLIEGIQEAIATPRDIERQDIDRSKIPHHSYLPDLFHAVAYRQGKIRVSNFMPFDLSVNEVVVIDRQGLEHQAIDQPVIVPPGRIGLMLNSEVIPLRLPEGENLDDHTIRIEGTSHGFTRQFETSLILDLESTDLESWFAGEVAESLDKIGGFASVTESEIRIREGSWNVDFPILVPETMTLTIPANVELKFSEDAYILNRGALQFLGTPQSPVSLRPAESSWKGIYSLEGRNSKLSHVKISGVHSFSVPHFDLSGGMTFYRTPVTIEHVTISNALAEVALSIVDSPFWLNGCEFAGTASDAIDVDLSTGQIMECSFRSIEGDCVAVARSNVMFEGIRARRVADGVVVARGGSWVRILDLEAKQVAVVARIRDGSIAELKDPAISEVTLIPFMTYTKKPFYGEARLNVVGEGMLASHGMAQPGTEIHVNGARIKARELDPARIHGPASLEVMDSP